ncbi:MAG: aminoglycoside phosphotransferase family protein [Saprospiraceae bacterium]|nr:aminoglycoside phosphotransferase family protein [Saprospiraceae bacterium]
MEIGSILLAFGYGDSDPKKIGSGHINETFLLEDKNGKKSVLQKINTKVFEKPELLMSNLVLVLDHLSNSDYPYNLMEIIPTMSGGQYIQDSKGLWRMLSYMKGKEASVRPANLKKAEVVAEGYGNFLKAINTLDPKRLHDTIKGFHGPEKRFQQFVDSTEIAAEDKLEVSSSLIDHALAFSQLTLQYSKCCDILPPRITHGDTKASNILVDKSGEKVSAVIDLDTVMSGFIMNDFGDMVRSMCNTGAEDDNKLEAIQLDLENFKGISTGFLRAFSSEITQEELDSLLIGVKSILYEQFLRFLTDFLQGDVYYTVDYPDQNLNRAKVHLKLLLDFQKREELFIDILNECLGQLDE